MSTSQLIRWAGMAGVLAGGLVVVSDVVFWLALGDQPTSVAAASSTWFLAVIVTLVSVYLALFALVGLYARQAAQSGGLGLTGFVLAFLGTMLTSGYLWAGAFIVPPLTEAAPGFLDAVDANPSGVVAAGFLSALVLFAAGWILFAIASVRARVLPSAPVWLLMIGAIVSAVTDLVGLPLGTVVFAVALGWLGWALWSEEASVSMRDR